MKVQIIGSGSMWTKYNSACYLIDKDIMVDFPNGTCKYLYRQNIEPRTINYVLLTHFHGDHYFDMPFRFVLLNRLNLCELFFEKSVREGGVIIFVKKWVLIGFLMD